MNNFFKINENRISNNKINQSISVIIAKPTRVCNANCNYCSSPPLEEMGESWEPEWNLDVFKKYFDKVYPYLINGANWIWHGGEPMLMGPKFYKDCYDYAQEKIKQEGRNVYFSMQSNLLGYNEKWHDVFENIFGGAISTSFDPDEKNRTIKDNPETYSRVFKSSLEKVLNDGFRPLVIGVYSEETAHMMHKMYDWSKSLGDKSFSLRFNYCHPSGRLENGGEAISPETYADYLIEVYNRWLEDAPNFVITPLDQMFKRVIDKDGDGHCPWTRKCGGRFIEIEPNGEIYNCSEFADIGKEYCFGNLNDNISLGDMLNTRPALLIKRRVTKVPVSCTTCEHYKDCEGGCMRDALLYNHGLYGKFHYCKSWKRVFTRIKESILVGDADKILNNYGLNIEDIKNKVKNDLGNYFNFQNAEIEDIVMNGSKNKYGFGDNRSKNNESNYCVKTGRYLLVDGEEEIKEVELKEKRLSINDKLKTIKIKIE